MTTVAEPTLGGIPGVRDALGVALTAATHDALSGSAATPPLLVSVSVPVGGPDPLDWFAAATAMGEDAACWLEPATGRALVGVGAAASISLVGPGRFRDAAMAWAALLADSVSGGPAAASPGAGPILLGGATFAERPSSDACWTGFETGRLDVPAIQMGVADGVAVLTCNLVVERSVDPAQLVIELLDRVDRLAAAATARAPRARGPVVRPLHQIGGHPDRATWSSSVARAAGAVGRGRIDKVVLARRVDLGAADRIDIPAVLARLATPPAATSAAPVTVFAFSRGGRTFLGASPERLVAATGRSFRTIALAGTTGRDADPAIDEALATALLASEKDREEHSVVVEMLHDTLAPLAARLDIDRTPQIMRLPTLQHLVTNISGDLRDDRGILDLVDRLHPTPAVGGWPRAAASELLEEQERLDRGWYAAPVGWVDARGDGEFVVAIRSGVIDGDQAHLFVGCGIVADSEPDREWVESSMKLQSLATALGQLDP